MKNKTITHNVKLNRGKFIAYSLVFFLCGLIIKNATGDDRPPIELSHDFSVINMTVSEVSFDGGYPISDVTDSAWNQDTGANPALCYQMGGAITMAAKFKITPSVNESTPCSIAADSANVTAETVSITITGDQADTGPMTTTPLEDTIGISDIDFDWKFALYDATPVDVPAGMSGTHRVFRTFDSLACPAEEFTKDHLEKACTYGAGGTGDNFITTVQHYIHSGKKWRESDAMDGQVWDVLEIGGSCIAHANLMKHTLKVLGQSATIAYVADASNQPSEALPQYNYYTDIDPETKEEYTYMRWFQENPLDDTHATNYEGVCGVGSIYYDVYWSTVSGTYDFLKTQGNGIVVRWARFRWYEDVKEWLFYKWDD